MLTRAQYFSIAVVIFMVIAVFTVLTPALVDVDLFYPNRKDSLRLESGAPALLLPDPSSVKLHFDSFSIRTADSLLLRGWYVPSTKEDAPTLLVLHDLNENKSEYVDLLRQLHDRELHVCIVDLRAHGNSEGREFSPGMASVQDVRILLDNLYNRPETRVVCLFGIGVSSFIAAQAAVLDDSVAGLLLQNPFSNYQVYLDYYAEKKWGRFQFLFRTAFLRKAGRQIQMDPSELSMSRLLSYVTKPTLFLAGGMEDFAAASESAWLKDSSAAAQKELFLIPGSFRSQMDEFGDEYYNRIAEFVVRTLPPKQKKSRYKRLASQ